jgi:flagellin-like protein
MKKLFRCRKALSPVIAAIILIAVTVAVSIAVAAWMGALTLTFMTTEQITFTVFVWGANNANAQITVKNTGTSDLSIQAVRIDGAAPASVDPSLTPPYVLSKGNSVTFTLTRAGGFISGTSYEFEVLTSKGNIFGPYARTAP